MKNFIIKNFGQFVNENRLRSELVGGKGQKAEYDTMSREDRNDLEMTFARLREQDPMIVNKFITGISKYRSLEELKSSLNNLLHRLEMGDDEERNQDRGYDNRDHDNGSNWKEGRDWDKGTGFFYREDQF